MNRCLSRFHGLRRATGHALTGAWSPLLLASLVSLPAAELVQNVYDVRQQLLVTVPHGTKQLRIWFAMPVSEPNQVIENFRVLAPGPHRRVIDGAGNRQVYVEAQWPDQETYAVSQTFRLTRTEQVSRAHPGATHPMSEAERSTLASYLEPGLHIPVDEEARRLATGILAGETNTTAAARRLYDWVVENTEYWVKYPERYAPSGTGSARYCLQSGSGDSADLHALWVSLARSAGIHSRMVFGTVLNAELNRMDTDAGSWCWAEYYDPGFGWVPLDVAMGDLFSGSFPMHDRNGRLVRLATAEGYGGPSAERVDYYFGNLDARRLVLSRGRDLQLNPPAAAGPVSTMAKAHVEADGQSLKEGVFWSRKLTFRQRKSW